MQQIIEAPNLLIPCKHLKIILYVRKLQTTKGTPFR